MRWPPWPSEARKDAEEKRRPVSWADNLNSVNWSSYAEPTNLIPTILLTATILVFVRVHRVYLRRITGATDVQQSHFRKRSLFGTVTRVGDGDNFHMFHTPGGRLTGWGWFPGRKVPEKAGDLKNRTIAIRIAGIDAPEGAHFGKEAQPYAAEALAWLKAFILNRRVRAQIYKRDQYDRVVATVFVRRGLFRRDVGLEMLKAGMATIYEAKTGAEFGNLESKYRSAESWAKFMRKGMWSASQKNFESPRAYKIRTGVGVNEEGQKDKPRTLASRVFGSKR